MTNLLEMQDVNVYYGHFHALRNNSLTVGEGEIVSLLGGNASGKSTTMRTILGLIGVKSGTVRFAGEDITHTPTRNRIKAGIASVPEARRVFPQMSVDENLAAGAYTRTDRAGIAEDLERMREHFPRLAERRRQAAGTLSGGEQQMLAFARALMSRPRLICMDEPTMGLSPKLVDQVLDEIVRINRELGVSILFVEQQAELALSIASRGYVLTTGEIVLKGTARELLDNPQIQEAYLGNGPRP
jgi:branched-chain amino acid transport system ATP-binding protein